jgi:hypothetical protein
VGRKVAVAVESLPDLLPGGSREEPPRELQRIIRFSA